MLKACPEIHRNRAELHLYTHMLLLPGKEYGNIQYQVQTPISIRLWILNVILHLNQYDIILLQQAFHQLIDIFRERADYADSCNIIQILFYILYGKSYPLSLDFAINALRTF